MQKTVLLVLVVIVTLSCSFHKDSSEMTADEHYKYAMELFEDEDYYEAENELRIITLRYSGTPITDDAQFYLAETYYEKEEYLVASSEYSRLIRDLPQSPYVEQASYKMALCYYHLSPRSELDQKFTENAIRELELFMVDYPYSEYNEDAKKYILELKTKLAKKLLKSAYIYRKLGAHDSALMYIDLLLERYYDTEVVKEALYEKGLVYLDQENWSMVKDILVKLRSVGAEDLYSYLLEDYAAEFEDFFGEKPEEVLDISDE